MMPLLRSMLLYYVITLIGSSPAHAFWTNSTWRPGDSPYQLVRDYTGSAFFGGFEFFNAPDPTNGHVRYVDLDTANRTGLAGIIQGGPHDGAVFLGVDAINVTPAGRPSVRVESKDRYNHALWFAHISHMPGGICGTWPAYWLLGRAEPWPKAGEIDIIEGINDQKHNKIVLHADSGVTIANVSRTANFTIDLSERLHKPGSMTARFSNLDCNVNGPSGAIGCVAEQEPLPGQVNVASFGTEFNAAGGAYIATEFTSKGINVWFLPHLPPDVAKDKPNPSMRAWGTPVAVFSGSPNFDAKFRDMSIIFNTAFCGSWAGKAWNMSSCAQLAPTCEDYVSNNPKAFQEAYWAIKSLKVYEPVTDDYKHSYQAAPLRY